MIDHINVKTLHDPAGKMPDLPDYWLVWANGVQGDGVTEAEAIASAKMRLADGDDALPVVEQDGVMLRGAAGEKNRAEQQDEQEVFHDCVVYVCPPSRLGAASFNRASQRLKNGAHSRT